MFPNHASPVKKKSIPSVPSPELVDFLYDNDLPEGVDVSLASVSARDSVWDKHRLDTLIIQEMYAIECEFERYSERMTDCSGWLKFGFNEVNGLVLKQAFFCRVRSIIRFGAQTVNRNFSHKKPRPGHRVSALCHAAAVSGVAVPFRAAKRRATSLSRYSLVAPSPSCAASYSCSISFSICARI